MADANGDFAVRLSRFYVTVKPVKRAGFDGAPYHARAAASMRRHTVSTSAGSPEKNRPQARHGHRDAWGPGGGPGRMGPIVDGCPPGGMRSRPRPTLPCQGIARSRTPGGPDTEQRGANAFVARRRHRPPNTALKPVDSLGLRGGPGHRPIISPIQFAVFIRRPAARASAFEVSRRRSAEAAPGPAQCA